MEPITTVSLMAYEGPNIYGPQPGVRLVAYCDSDRSAEVRAALKEGAQFIGLILAYLEVTAQEVATGAWLVTASFTTPAPALGAELAAYVVAGVRATANGDNEWERDEPLYALQKRRRRESPSATALQLVAEARARRLPVLHRADGMLQIGYGARGWSFAADSNTPPTPPWERLGSIPLFAVTGERLRSAIVARLAGHLATDGRAVTTVEDAGFDELRTLLADPQTEVAVVGLRGGDLLRRGLACEVCAQAIVADSSGRPPGVEAEDWVRALGLPLLVSRRPAYLDSNDPELATLAEYAPYGVRPLEDLWRDATG